ncbi:MAG: sodium-dependent transporter [Calditrichaceae bacterium]|nr:sodium-dependent transporter [Calditrichia bacterium]NUQ42805.1 sodium-dependent transporter [Calditrichaceae bacterium]
MEKKEQFTSRWALLLATLGMAIGAGNIWRFPRLAGQYGGAFLIPWAIFLILWSIPLLMVEFSLGKETRKGPIGAFAAFLGKNYTWMGGFVCLCTSAIMFYYSVVTGWALKYFSAAALGNLAGANHQQFWESFIASGYQPILFHLLALGVAGVIIYRGIVNGIERANRILLPALFVLLVIGAARSLTLPNAAEGLNYFFGFHHANIFDYKMWLEALSQSAWSTGAGWGLVLTYAVYARQREDVTLNAFITGFGNNSASLFAGLAIIPAVFSLAPAIGRAPLDILQEGNEGLSFIFIPQLFEKLPGGQIMSALFFLALFFAALSSLIAMLELAARTFMDFGIRRQKSLPIVIIVTALLGIPSALSLKFFKNQDWVWGLGLIISGSFFAFGVIKNGVKRFREKFLVAESNDLRIGAWFDGVMKYLIPLEAAALLVWWFNREWDAQMWWNPLSPFSLGTCFFQWGILIAALILVNKLLYRWVTRQSV